MVKKRKRLYIFDNLKFILMALVVIGHFADTGASRSPAFQGLYLFIYSFHMPLFLFISGMFHKNTKILQKMFTFVALGYVSKVAIWLSQLILFRVNEFSFFSDIHLPWYMFVLAMFIGVSYLVRNVDKKILIPVSIAVACLAGYFNFIGDFLYLSRFLVFLPFYLLGQITPKIVLVNLNKMKEVKIISAVILLVWFVLCMTKTDTLYILRPLFTGRNPYSIREELEVIGFFVRLLCYLITTLISLCVICLAPLRKTAYVSDSGTKTLQVYFWHTSLLLFFRRIGIADLLVGSFFGKVLWLAIGAGVVILLNTKWFAFPTKQVSDLCDKLFKKLSQKKISPDV